MNPVPLALRSQDFLKFLDGWTAGLSEMSLESALGDPGKTALISVDVIQGFCTAGPLASPRVGAIVEPIVHLFEAAWARGVRNILLFQDTHEPDAVEFGSWPPHCVRGTAEAEPVAAFQELPFFDQLPQYPKNSIASGLNTGLTEWVAAHPGRGYFHRGGRLHRSVHLPACHAPAPGCQCAPAAAPGDRAG